jgi:Cu-Zn family superoxide dismutase
MRLRTALLATAIGVAVTPLATAQEQATASFIDEAGKTIGEATVIGTPNGVLVDIEVEGLPAGEHAFHIHETGTCTPPDFTSAGGHYAEGRKHGFLVEGGPHPGDFPNQFVGENGRLRAHLFDTGLTIAGEEAPLLDDDGSAFIIHAGADDYERQPSGAAGARIACGVIEPG